MIGLDFPIRPQWIHDVHALWQPAQPINELMQTAKAQTMLDLEGLEARRKRLTIILRYFVATEGGGNSRCTAEHDIWVAYSRAYSASTMAPAYLAHLIAQNEVAQQATGFLVRRYALGDTLSSGELRQYIIGQFGERKVVTNTVSAFLRTLHYFSVLDEGERRGEYRFAALLPVSREAFPLIVWAWWQRHLSPQIDLEGFEEDAVVAFLESEDFESCWKAYQPALWVLEQRMESRRATLKYGQLEGFEQALLHLTQLRNR